jgi:hypothetical protein
MKSDGDGDNDGIIAEIVAGIFSVLCIVKLFPIESLCSSSKQNQLSTI